MNKSGDLKERTKQFALTVLKDPETSPYKTPYKTFVILKS